MFECLAQAAGPKLNTQLQSSTKQFSMNEIRFCCLHMVFKQSISQMKSYIPLLVVGIQLKTYLQKLSFLFQNRVIMRPSAWPTTVLLWQENQQGVLDIWDWEIVVQESTSYVCVCGEEFFWLQNKTLILNSFEVFFAFLLLNLVTIRVASCFQHIHVSSIACIVVNK